VEEVGGSTSGFVLPLPLYRTGVRYRRIWDPRAAARECLL